MNRPQSHVAATAFLSLFSIVGFALYGLPFFYDFFVRDLGWTRQQVTSGNAYSKLLVGPLFGFLAGWFIDRFGPRRLMLAGILMAGGALVGLGAVSTLGFFYLFYLFNALGYVCGGPLPNQVLLSRWFDRNRGKAMGFAYLGIGVGGAIVPLLAHALTQRYGWQAALQILGVLMLVVAFPMAWFVREKPEEIPPGGANQQPSNVNLQSATAQSSIVNRQSSILPGAPAQSSIVNRQPSILPDAPAQSSIVNRQSSISAGALPSLAPVLKSPAFYLLMVGSMCSIGAVGGTMQNLKLFLSLDVKLGQGEVAQIASLVLVGSLIGRIAMGYLADRFAKKYVMLLIYSIVACTIPLLFLADVPGARYGFAVLFGIGLGGDYMIIPLMAAELFGVKMLGRLMGIVLTADGIAEATAPMLVAGIRDATGSYASGFGVLIGLAVLGAVAVALLPKRLPA